MGFKKRLLLVLGILIVLVPVGYGECNPGDPQGHVCNWKDGQYVDRTSDYFTFDCDWKSYRGVCYAGFTPNCGTYPGYCTLAVEHPCDAPDKADMGDGTADCVLDGIDGSYTDDAYHKSAGYCGTGGYCECNGGYILNAARDKCEGQTGCNGIQPVTVGSPNAVKYSAWEDIVSSQDSADIRTWRYDTGLDEPCTWACEGGTVDTDDSDGVVGCIRQICGNALIEGTEVCDGGNLNGKTCAGFTDYQGGNLACASDCLSFDTSGCYKTCGTGTNEACESYDGARCSSDTGKLAFKTDGNPEEPFASLSFPSDTDCSGQFPVCNCARCNPGYEWRPDTLACETIQTPCDRYPSSFACFDPGGNPMSCIYTGFNPIYIGMACCSAYPIDYNYNYWVPIEIIP